MVAFNSNLLLERAEGTTRLARSLLERDPSSDTALNVVADAARAMWQAMNAVLLVVGVSEDNAEVMSRIGDDLVKKGLLTEDAYRMFLDAQSARMRFVYGADDANADDALKLLSWANDFIAITRKAVEDAALNEHDVIRVTHDVESDGYEVKRDMTGTIISVYNGGEAYAVEIAEIDDGPAVVTLRANEMERTWKAPHE
jgi:hypothetical protein